MGYMTKRSAMGMRIRAYICASPARNCQAMGGKVEMKCNNEYKQRMIMAIYEII